MVSWRKNIRHNSKGFNGVSLWFDIRKTYDVKNIISLCDRIFEWSEAVYGHVSDKTKQLVGIQLQMGGYRQYALGIYEGLYGLMWLNYFGKPYIDNEKFILPQDYEQIAHGVKMRLSEKPDDKKLSDISYLESYYSKIGPEWFWHFNKVVKEGGHYIAYLKEGFSPEHVYIPHFDNSQIVRKEIEE